MIAAVIIAVLLTVIAVKARAVGAALVLGVITVVLVGVLAPDVLTGAGNALAAVIGGLGEGLSDAANAQTYPGRG